MTEEFITYEDGVLTIEGQRADRLADRFGTPFYVTSEAQIRHNYRALEKAFSIHGDVTILFANKANNNVAVRHILTDEGAGGDCFGLGELTFALECGVPADRLVLNGSNKGKAEIELAVKSGVTINADHSGELELIEATARAAGKTALVNLRILPFSFADLSTLSAEMAEIAADTSHDKWGMGRAELGEAVSFSLASRYLRLRGLHMHVSRITATEAPFRLATKLLAQCACELSKRFGWTPELVDIGGGYAHARDPESGYGAGSHRVASAEDYACAVVNTMKEEFARLGLKLPKLWLEPGRYLVSNSTLLITRIGLVKKVQGEDLCWVHVDASTNHCLRASLQNYHYRISGVKEQPGALPLLANVTGPTCTMDLIAERRTIPAVAAGDLVAIWDVGGYAEVTATQFNLIPRPPAVLVSGEQVDLIRRREELADVMRTQIVPARLGGQAQNMSFANREGG